jgi:hypothetical protein
LTNWPNIGAEKLHEKDMMAARAYYAEKMGDYFERYHLGIACSKILFRDIATTSFN